MDDETLYFYTKKNRNQFARGVFALVSLIFLLACFLTVIFYFLPELTNYTYNYGTVFYVFLGLFLFVYFVLFFFDELRRNPPIHFLSFVIFTLFFGLMWAALAAFCALPEVLMVLVLLLLAALTIMMWASCIYVRHWALYLVVAAVIIVAVIILFAVKCGLGYCKDKGTTDSTTSTATTNATTTATTSATTTDTTSSATTGTTSNGTTSTPSPYDRKKDKYNNVASILVVLFLALLLGLYMVFFIQRMVKGYYCCALERNEYIFGALTLFTDILALPVDVMYCCGILHDNETYT